MKLLEIKNAKMMFLVVYVSKPRDREMESCRDLLGIKLGFKDLDQEHITYMMLLEESSRTSITLGDIFGPKREKRKRDFDGFKSLHVFEIDGKGVRTLPSCLI